MGNPPTKILEVSFDHRTIRDILDELSSMAGDAAWSASYKQSPATCQNLDLAEYQPKGSYPGEQPFTWIEGMRKECTECHYHQSQWAASH